MWGSMSPFKRIIALACAALAYWSVFAPSAWLRVRVLEAFGNPPYEGVWVFLPHVFLYSTLSALVAALLWAALSATRVLPEPEFRMDGKVALWGIGGGLAALALTLGYFLIFYPPGMVHWIEPKVWSIAGNVFSNFYEEFLYRGFLLVALTAALGFWPAAVLSSIAFGATHTQYPLDLQVLIAAAGFMWAVVQRQARSIWAPYISHMVLDVVGGSFIG